MADIHSDNALPTKRELIDNAKRKAEGQPAGQQRNIFAAGRADNGAGQPNEQQSTAKADHAGSGEKGQQDSGLKFFRSPEERLKDRERARQLERILNREHKFTVRFYSVVTKMPLKGDTAIRRFGKPDWVERGLFSNDRMLQPRASVHPIDHNFATIYDGTAEEPIKQVWSCAICLKKSSR